jgi:hypothetical protein
MEYLKMFEVFEMFKMFEKFINHNISNPLIISDPSNNSTNSKLIKKI